LNATPPDGPASTCPLPVSVFGVFAAGRAFDRDAEALAATYRAGLPFPHFVPEPKRGLCPFWAGPGESRLASDLPRTNRLQTGPTVPRPLPEDP
jgi:hypothetical protein